MHCPWLPVLLLFLLGNGLFNRVRQEGGVELVKIIFYFNRDRFFALPLPLGAKPRYKDWYSYILSDEERDFNNRMPDGTFRERHLSYHDRTAGRLFFSAEVQLSVKYVKSEIIEIAALSFKTDYDFIRFAHYRLSPPRLRYGQNRRLILFE